MEQSDSPHRQRKRVLVIDDDVLVGRALIRILGRFHQVELRTNPREALDLLLGGEDFDVVLTDLMMPDLSGMQIYEALRSRDPGLAERLIFVTGGAFTREATDFIRTVPNPYLEKPFDTAELLRLIDSVGRQRSERP